MQYASVKEIESRGFPGVRLRIRRMSFERRSELAQEIREIASRVEFLSAGTDPKEQMSAALLAREVDQTYLRWGLAGIDGLELDGVPATPETLVRDGPEALV